MSPVYDNWTYAGRSAWGISWLELRNISGVNPVRLELYSTAITA